MRRRSGCGRISNGATKMRNLPRLHGGDVQRLASVLADHSISAASPERWARAVAGAAALYHRQGGEAPLIVAEVNQGGRMVESVLRSAGPGLRIKLVRASEGKAARAEPVALLFEAGRVRVHGRMEKLEA